MRAVMTAIQSTPPAELGTYPPCLENMRIGKADMARLRNFPLRSCLYLNHNFRPRERRSSHP